MPPVDLETLKAQVRRAEFNRTEAETAAGLVHEAIQRGDEARAEHERLSALAQKVSILLEERGWFHHVSDDDLPPLAGQEIFCGLDGSFFALPSSFDLWYVPISVAKVRQRFDFQGVPEVVAEPKIAALRPLPGESVFRGAELEMLVLESRALMLEAENQQRPRILMDGPVADPPFPTPDTYVELRTDALKRCLENELTVIGCVKRVSDRFIPTLLSSSLDAGALSSMQTFPNDMYLMTHALAKYRSKHGYGGPLLTEHFDISHLTPNHKAYWDRGVGILSGFYQHEPNSRVVRVDVPFLRDSFDVAGSSGNEAFRRAAGIFRQLTLPGQSYPVPVMLAHEKCKVRQGAAEVLYLEIMTKSATVSPEDFVTLMQLR